VAKAFIGKVSQAKADLFQRVEKRDNSWLIEGEVWFKRLRLFTVKKTFRLKISSKIGKTTSYQQELVIALGSY
jgi:hypothetical protein